MASLITTDIAFTGHVKLILKSDNEPALLALADAALREIKCQVQKSELNDTHVSTEPLPPGARERIQRRHGMRHQTSPRLISYD